MINKKLLFALTIIILLASFFMSYTVFKVLSENWTAYESGRNNIRLEGYDSQVGYIAFGDGDGNVLGYLFPNPADNGALCWVTDGLFTTTSRIGEGDNLPYQTVLTD